MGLIAISLETTTQSIVNALVPYLYSHHSTHLGRKKTPMNENILVDKNQKGTLTEAETQNTNKNQNTTSAIMMIYQDDPNSNLFFNYYYYYKP